MSKKNIDYITLFCFIIAFAFLSYFILSDRQEQATTATPAPITSTSTVPIPTVTPWVKQDILIEMSPGLGINIWTDNIETDIIKVRQVEGVIDVIVMHNGHMISAGIDPRYDKVLVGQDIKNLLSEVKYE